MMTEQDQGTIAEMQAEYSQDELINGQNNNQHNMRQEHSGSRNVTNPKSRQPSVKLSP